MVLLVRRAHTTVRGWGMVAHVGQMGQMTILTFSILTCRYEMLCRICVVQIQPRKHALDYAGYTAPTQQHELDHTDHTDHTDQESVFPVWQMYCT